MNISATSSTSPLLKQLEANGVTARKAVLVQQDLATAQAATASSASPSVTPATRAAFEAKISEDVLSGKLSASDAAAVRKTMDSFSGSSLDAAASPSSPAVALSSQAGSTAAASKPGGGGGGGGGNASKTEASESVTISGSTMTTVITYTDGTTSTTTTTATDADKARYDKAESGDQLQVRSAGYSPTPDKGALVNQLA